MKKSLFTMLAVVTALTASAQLRLTMEYTKTVTERGELYQYSERYLGPCDVVTEEKVTYELKGIHRANDNQSASKTARKESGSYTHTQMPVALSEEVLLAGNTAKKAELVAKQIYRIREARLNLLSGDVEHMPADGRSTELILDELRYQERQLTQLFVGKKHITTMKMTFTCPMTCPMDSDVTDMTILRFSKFTGPTDKDDLSGEPLLLTVHSEMNTVPVEVIKGKHSETILEEKKVRTDISINYGHKQIFETTLVD